MCITVSKKNFFLTLSVFLFSLMLIIKMFTPYSSKLFFQLNNFLMEAKKIHVTITGVISLIMNAKSKILKNNVMIKQLFGFANTGKISKTLKALFLKCIVFL